MGTLCLSQALILRCESLTQIQNISLFIPTCVEVLFASALLFGKWRSDRRYLLLTFEGWVYFALALLELLSHILPAVRDDLEVFKIVDIVLGAASSLPLLLYTTFLCIFTCTELLDGLPHRLQRFGKFGLVILIPVVLVLNELASFIGITHRIVNSRLAIGFSNQHSKTLWSFITDFDLGFITGYQFLNFSFAFFRLAKAFLEQQRIESSEADELIMFRGTGWIALGIPLGGLETCIGFIYPRFGLILARRILRLLGRASLIIGVFKGLDVSEDFQVVREEILAGTGKRSFRGSRIRPLMISDPRLSTFRQLSPDATQQTSNTFRQPRPFSVNSGPPGARVTVHFDASSGRAPTLQMRFSGLDMPSPAEIVESVKSRPASEWVSTAPSRKSSYYADSTMTRHTIAVPDFPEMPMQSLNPTAEPELPPQPIIVPNVFAHSRNISNYSMNSGFQDSVNSMDFSVTGLAQQFPGLPPQARMIRNSMAMRNSTLPVVPEAPPNTESGGGMYNAPLFRQPPNESLGRKRGPGPRNSVVLTPAPLDPFTDDETQFGVTLPAPLRNSEHVRQMSIALSAGLTNLTSATTTTDDSLLFTRPQTSPQPTSSEFTTPTTAQTEDPFKYDHPGVARPRSSVVPPPTLAPVREYDESPLSQSSGAYSSHYRGKSMETLDISWLTRPGPGPEDYGVDMDIDDIDEDFTVERAMRKKISSGPQRRRSRSAPRIKSIGKAPRRYTPSPTTATSYTRDSVYVGIEPIAIPPNGIFGGGGGFSNVELEQGSLNGSRLSGPLRDSEVFGREGEVIR